MVSRSFTYTTDRGTLLMKTLMAATLIGATILTAGTAQASTPVKVNDGSVYVDLPSSYKNKKITIEDAHYVYATKKLNKWGNLTLDLKKVKFFREDAPSHINILVGKKHYYVATNLVREKNGYSYLFPEQFKAMAEIETDGISGDGDKLELVQGSKVVKAGEIGFGGYGGLYNVATPARGKLITLNVIPTNGMDPVKNARIYGAEGQIYKGIYVR